MNATDGQGQDTVNEETKQTVRDDMDTKSSLDITHSLRNYCSSDYVKFTIILQKMNHVY